MKAKLFLNTNKTNSEGNHPVWIRLAAKKSKKYIATGVHLTAKQWNDGDIRHKNRAKILKNINSRYNKYLDKIEELEAEGREVSLDKLVELVDKPVKSMTVYEYFKERIRELKALGRIGNARAHTDALNALKRYKKGDVLFSEIDHHFLHKWALFLAENGASDAAINIYMRTLRAVFNMAIKNKYAKREYYPFGVDGYSIATNHPSEKQFKALSTKQIDKLMSLDIDSKYYRYMLFCYFTGGMDFEDMAHLTYNNIDDDVIIYKRRKNRHKLNQPTIEIPISDRVLAVIDHFRSDVRRLDKQDYIFDVLNKYTHETDQQQHDRIKKVRKEYNKQLRKFAAKVGITENITSKVIRHSALTELARRGANVLSIQQIGGHKKAQTTRGYMKSAGREETMKDISLLG